MGEKCLNSVNAALADFKSANTGVLGSPPQVMLQQIQQLRREVTALTEDIALNSAEEPSGKLAELVACVARHSELQLDQSVVRTQCQSCSVF